MQIVSTHRIFRLSDVAKLQIHRVAQAVDDEASVAPRGGLPADPHHVVYRRRIGVGGDCNHGNYRFATAELIDWFESTRARDIRSPVRSEKVVGCVLALTIQNQGAQRVLGNSQ